MKLGIFAALLSLVCYGEGVHLLGPSQEQGTAMVVHVFLNRLESFAFPNDPEGVIASGFWGYSSVRDDPPTWIAPIVVREIQRHRQGYDPTGGALYVFSLDDVIENRFTWHEATARAKNGSYGLYTYRKIPDPFPNKPKLLR